jgi:hypothetical protein
MYWPYCNATTQCLEVHHLLKLFSFYNMGVKARLGHEGENAIFTQMKVRMFDNQRETFLIFSSCILNLGVWILGSCNFL